MDWMLAINKCGADRMTDADESVVFDYLGACFGSRLTTVFVLI